MLYFELICCGPVYTRTGRSSGVGSPSFAPWVFIPFIGSKEEMGERKKEEITEETHSTQTKQDLKIKVHTLLSG